MGYLSFQFFLKIICTNELGNDIIDDNVVARTEVLSLKPNFTLAPIFADNLIFQAGKPLYLFGTCQKKKEIRVRIAGKIFKFKTTDTEFAFELPEMPYTKEPFDFEVVCGWQTVTIHNCLVGDVFIACGQANMDYPLKNTFETRVKENPQIRFFDVPKRPYSNASLEFPMYFSAKKPEWKPCSYESAMEFSAIGYFVSQNLEQELNIPIGIICCSFVDSSVFSWTGMNELVQNTSLQRYLNYYRSEITKYKTLDEYAEHFNQKLPRTMEFYQNLLRLEKQSIPAERVWEEAKKQNPDFILPMGQKHYNRPAGVFETMVKSIAPYTVKAVIYYQGDADLAYHDLYEDALKTLFKSWRRVFMDLGLPFVIVQIPGYTFPGHPEFSAAFIREAQRKCINFLNNIYLCSAVDIGEEDDQHPKEKTMLSRRLANVILEKIYRQGKNNICPSLYSYQIGSREIIIYTDFNHLNLVSHSNRCLGFKISYDGEKFVDPESVSLMNNQIIISTPKKVKEIRYAFQNFPHCDIYTTNELPLLPFRIVLDL